MSPGRSVLSRLRHDMRIRRSRGTARRWQAHEPGRGRRPAHLVALALLVGLGVALARLDPATAALAGSGTSPAAQTLTFAPVPAHDEVAATPIRVPVRDTPPASSAMSAPKRPVVLVPESKPIVVPRTAPSGSTAVFLGDSYTSGWSGAGLGARGWPRIVGVANGWKVVNLAVPGTGFINPGWTGQPIGSRVQAAIDRHPAVVVIAGGHNDSRWSTTSVAAAADRVIQRLRAALPNARLVIVAPIWPSGTPPTRCLVLRDHLRRTAASVGAVLVDPLAENWFGGSRHSMILADGIHPSDAGHRYIAQRVLARLVRA
jgi:lysophospholipase L1-like esterase